MEIEYSKDSIILKNKSLSDVDKFVLEFVDIIKNHFRYVIVSGYVAILFGRSRGTEDIDILIEKITKSEFFNFVSEIEDRYDFLNPEDKEGLYEMLSENLGIRISKKNEIIPNIEFKIIKNEVEKYVLDNRLKVELDKNLLYISPIEIQIAYKLYLGSEKDIIDAIHLNKIFHNYIKQEELEYWAKYFKVEGKLKNCLVKR
ncbi:MAG: hypothetical protein APG12_01147 [Candidatus Methanofastidiosum methylothiophilum]|uniref:Uncharacterized protein n=2 Tax=Candidatus Methanofastidiosum methylothiophilum TaxID=1705564 RepID=A0A150IYI8_9EURY|nr:MAG: hypothetical protein APG11_00263 [Candidatus Methanofastidiosum methylthiophilus]KYC49898.1 MAG: hypothetical protein APG12_01147 [Candidatus Methanofastidiosum methylthiophilus]